MIRTLMTKFFHLTLFFATLLGGSSCLFAQVIETELKQSQEAITVDQRLVGNVGAQAKREGVILDVPQLFVYYRDYSPAYHLSGFRPTMTKELDLVVDDHRIERSMVKLERLVERAYYPDQTPLAVSDLPAASLYVVFYTKADCAQCAQTETVLRQWLETRDQPISLMLIGVDAD